MMHSDSQQNFKLKQEMRTIFFEGEAKESKSKVRSELKWWIKIKCISVSISIATVAIAM